jgi:hypothetical protein
MVGRTDEHSASVFSSFIGRDYFDLVDYLLAEVPYRKSAVPSGAKRFAGIVIVDGWQCLYQQARACFGV